MEDGKPNIYIEGELLQYEFFLLERLEKMASGIYEPLTEDFYEIVENYKEIPSEFLIIFLKALSKNSLGIPIVLFSIGRFKFCV